MRTYSHYLMTHALGRSRGVAAASLTALSVGSVVPDAPLILLGVAHFATQFASGSSFQAAVVGFQASYFGDLFWQCAHSLLHTPLPIALLAYVAWRFRRRAWGPQLGAFVVGVVGHFVVDLFTHHDDGPLLLFPFDFRARFASPLSYWDAAHYGVGFTIFEHILDLLLLAWVYLRRRSQPLPAATPGSQAPGEPNSALESPHP